MLSRVPISPRSCKSVAIMMGAIIKTVTRLSAVIRDVVGEVIDGTVSEGHVL